MMLNNHFLPAKDQSLEVVILPLVETQVKLSATRPNIVSKEYSASQLDAKPLAVFISPVATCWTFLPFVQNISSQT